MIQPALLAFSARIASGKSTLSSSVAEMLGWPRAAFGDYLRGLAGSRGLNSERETLQELGEGLVRSDLEGFCRAVLRSAGWEAGKGVVVDGIRHIDTVSMLKRIVVPVPVFLIYMDVAEPIRRERLELRGISSGESCRLEEHVTEQDVVNLLPKLADMRVDGSEKVDVLASRVVSWLEHKRA